MNTTGIGTASNTVHLQVNGVGRTVNVRAESNDRRLVGVRERERPGARATATLPLART